MGLNALDISVVVAYLAAVTLFGLRFRARNATLRGYFLADQSAPWWAISLSIVAAETSTLTIISIPGLAFGSDFRFLQLVFGYLVGRVFICLFFIPQYFRGSMVTAYELMQRRFGTRMRLVAGVIFLFTRAAAEGVRVFAVAIIVGVALGPWVHGFSGLSRDVIAIAVVTVLTLIYTFHGGMAAVIWTDVVQLGIYLCGTVIAVVSIVHFIPGGMFDALSIANEAGKFRVFDGSWNLTSTYTIWSGVIGGAFLTAASHGTDQLIVQRLLSARSESQSKMALLSSGVIILFQFSLFLLVGALLFVMYRSAGQVAIVGRTDTLFPKFIVEKMMHGLSGLLIAAILAAAMSNLSAALNALSSTTIVDFLARFRPEVAEHSRVAQARWVTVGWAAVLFCLAVLARGGGKVIETGLAILSVSYGALLGVFLLGVLTRRATERGALIGFIAGIASSVYLWRFTPMAFTWYVVFGSGVTFAVGLLASLGGNQTMRIERKEAECN